MTSSSITGLDARTLSAAIAARKLSCVEVMEAYLDRIAALNPRVNAIVALQDRDALLAQARERDAQVARSEIMGPLHGFPHAVKDILAVKGIRSTSGSPALKDFVPAQDALVVERMRAAGAIFIGKTNVPEFGLGSHTINPVYGPTLNPYDLTKSAGGSSGGAAVGLALRILPVADGTDYGGSLRNPAGWNNVFGFRPSFGVVPATGEDVWLPSQSTAGPMARNVSDLALLLSVQAGFDARAPLSDTTDGRRFLTPLESDVKGKRIAWLGDMKGFTPYDDGVLDTCREALKTFEALGCVVEEALPEHPFEPVWQAFIRIRQWQAGGGFRILYNDARLRSLLKPEAIWETEQGAKLSAYDVLNASIQRTSWSNAMQRLFARYDYIIAPTAQVFPFAIAETWPRQVGGQAMQTYHEWMKANCMITMSGCPALAVPAGFGPQGLPMGLQIVAPIHREMDCLKLAHAYEAASDWTNRRPPPLLDA